MCSMVSPTNCGKKSMQVKFHLVLTVFQTQSICHFQSIAKTAAFINAMAMAENECDCLPECDVTEYQYSATSTSLR